MSKDKKTTKKQNVENVDNYNYEYTVFYAKIFKNNKRHHLRKTFKTFNAAKRFKARCIINPKVYNVYIYQHKIDYTCKKCVYNKISIFDGPCMKCNNNYSQFTATETF